MTKEKEDKNNTTSTFETNNNTNIMVNNNTISLSSPDSEFKLPLNVSLVSPKSEMPLPASKPKVAVSMVLNEDKTEIIKTEVILDDDFDEKWEIPTIKQEKDCTVTNLTCQPPNDHPTLKLEIDITQELVVNIVQSDLEKLSKDTNAALSKPRTIKREASNDIETDIKVEKADNGDWIVKNEEVHIKYEEGEDDGLRSSSINSNGRDNDDNKYQTQQSRKGSARRSKKRHKLVQRIHHCPQCGYETSRPSNLKSHINIIHGMGKSSEKYSCSKCTFQTFYKQHMVLHIRRHDGVKVKQHRCSRCAYGTSRKQRLADHVCDKELEVLTCYDCGYQTVIKALLRMHVLCHSHTENFAFNCNVCSFGTKRKQSLKSHMLRHNTNLDGFKKYKCTKCDYQSHVKGRLKIHALIHMADADVTRYSCYHCDYRTLRKHSLILHVLRHNKRAYEAKTLKCSDCDYKTVYKQDLKKHIRGRHKKTGRNSQGTVRPIRP